MDDFKVIVPAELIKAKDGSWKIAGLASTGSVDRQGEIIVPDGIDATPIDQGRGAFNYDHDNSPESTIGLLDSYKKTSKGLYVEGRLFKNHKKAQAVYEIMSSLGKGDKSRMGFSVEGKVIERDPLNPKVIRRCIVKNVALTMNPVNTDTYADMVKSMAGAQIEFDATGTTTNVVKAEETPCFTASQVMQIVEKALSIGAGNALPPDQRTGGDALGMSNMAEDPKKKKMKKLEKGMFKANMEFILSRLQVLHPEASRDQLWAAVKDRMSHKFEQM